MTTNTNPLPLKINDLHPGMKVYRKSTLAAAVNEGYLEYEIVQVFQEDGYIEIQFKDEEEKYVSQVKGDGTVSVYFPGSSKRWQPIYGSKGKVQYGGTRKNKRATRKNKRATRKNKRPTRRGRRRASCI